MNQISIRQIPFEFIKPNPWQARQGDSDPAYIKELALDIAANGLLQTPIGRMIDAQGKTVGAVQIEAHGGEIAYLVDNPGAIVQLAFGHNRLAAYRWLHDLRDNSDIAGDWSAMPVDVRTLTDEQMAIFAWSENEKRRDVTAIERARAIQNRLDSFKWTNRQCAEALGIDHSTVSNLLRLLKLPEDLQQAILDGKVSERQAMAILPVFEAPFAVGDSNSYGYYSYSTNSEGIKKAVLEGESSDELRRKVDAYFSYKSKDLAQAEFKLDQLFPEGEGIYCGLCKTCDRRFASRNRCFDADCFNVKTKLVHQVYLSAASKASGYPPIDEQKNAPTTSLPYEKEKRDRIIATGCPNLRLEYTVSESEYCLIDGYPHAKLVCDKRNGSCTCIKGLAMLKGLETPEDEDDDMVIESGEEDESTITPVHSPIESESPVASQTAATRALSADELEDAALQARRDKKAALEQLPEIRKRLEDHLYHAMADYEAPGAIFVAVYGHAWPSKQDIELDQLYRNMAKRAANVIIPAESPSERELLKTINYHLENLNLEKLDIVEMEGA